MTMLRKLAPDLWVAERPLPIAVGDLGARMTVLRGASGAAAARRSIDAILAWDFERLIMSHGDVLERGGRTMLEAAFRYLRA